MMKGKIIRGVGGFYYVDVGFVAECRAKGIFRKQNVKPLVGDDVEIEILDEELRQGNLISIYNRKNELIRPAVANVDQSVVIFALSHPRPNLNLLDRFLLTMQIQGIDTIICFNKSDDQEQDMIRQLTSAYAGSQAKVIVTSTVTKEGIDSLRRQLAGKTSVMAGPSGVGKSSVMNVLFPDAGMETGKISDKIKRGRHTTRHTELFCIEKETYIMDTPGFTSLRLPEMEKEELESYYPEFIAYRDNCRFLSCTHIHEPDCAVREALAQGKIPQSRYENYKQFFEELQQSRKY